MPKRNLIWIAAILAAALVTALVTRDQGRVDSPGSSAPDPSEQALHLIRDRYLRPLSDACMDRLALEGVVSRLDAYSHYFGPDQAAGFARRMNGKCYGLGLKVQAVDGEVQIVGPLVDSPAQSLGLFAGDRLLAVNGQDVGGLGTQDVEDLLDDASAPAVELTVLTAYGKTKTVTASRGEYSLQSVQGLLRDATGRWIFMLEADQGLGYIRIREFLPAMMDQMQSALHQLDHPRGLVLDLRDNPGGSLPAAIEVTGKFLRQGVIVTEVDRQGRLEEHMARSAGALPDDILVVVLVNENTASAAELVAGALRYHGRAVVVGQRTRGKGCVQSMFNLDKLGWVNLTTSEFYVDPCQPISRQARSDRWGVEPHLTVPMGPLQWRELCRLAVHAEVLPPPDPATRPAGIETVAVRANLRQTILRQDVQLQEALALLKDAPRMKQLMEENPDPNAGHCP